MSRKSCHAVRELCRELVKVRAGSSPRRHAVWQAKIGATEQSWRLAMKCSYAATALVLAGAFLVAPCAAQIIVVPSTSLQVFQNPSGQVIAYASGHVPSCGITPDDSEP